MTEPTEETQGYTEGWDDGDAGRPQLWGWDGPGLVYAVRRPWPENPPSEEWIRGYADGYYNGKAE